LGNELVGNAFELIWSTNKLLADVIGQLEYRDEITDAESETHPCLYLLRFKMVLEVTMGCEIDSPQR